MEKKAFAATATAIVVAIVSFFTSVILTHAAS